MNNTLIQLKAEIFRQGQYSPPCPEGWCWFGQHCYYFSSSADTWNASSYCASNNSNLVVINSIDEQGFVKCNLSDSHWIGLRRNAGDAKQWHWVDGTIYTASEGSSITPDSCGCSGGDNCKECCGVINSGTYLNASTCTTPMKWVCEKSAHRCPSECHS
ncbi:killer cell lectin-like receptor subfamily G member 1 [Leucoraja erinacea]|uniref:killer cell lectin-like receptor subfamily G member 1 n=1 Tax=Leucoraja erinaceus TaxID=7782 RepID=UPI0024570B4C|nr:killer cell lectin-like receptor subfamily G member 1 [Leucoraja erinacea]